MLSTFNLPKNNKIRNIKKKASKPETNSKFRNIHRKILHADISSSFLCPPPYEWTERFVGQREQKCLTRLKPGRVQLLTEDTGKPWESLMLCSTAKANAIQTLGLAITTELLKYLLQVKLVKNNREKPTHYEMQPLLSGIYSLEMSQEKFREQP